MPSLLLISASGTAQRRLLEETVADFEKKGYVISGKQEGGEWGPLLSDNLSGGLFDENRIVIVDSASILGPFPENLDPMVDADSPVVLLLVYDSDPAKVFPPQTLQKCRIIKAPPFPRWPRERMMWTIDLAGEMKIKIDREAAALIIELTEDPEEIRRQLSSLSLLKKGGTLNTSDIENMCLDDGTRNLLKLLDGLCSGDHIKTLKSLHAISKNGDLIPLVSAMHNRMRLAWYSSMHPHKGSLFAESLGAKNYAWSMAGNAARKYSAGSISKFVLGLIKINIDEKSGTGSGWAGLETLVIELMGC
ncbi:MAG: DNA polymerase III subunit delta [Synergistaceae bacterium]